MPPVKRFTGGIFVFRRGARNLLGILCHANQILSIHRSRHPLFQQTQEGWVMDSTLFDCRCYDTVRWFRDRAGFASGFTY